MAGIAGPQSCASRAFLSIISFLFLVELEAPLQFFSIFASFVAWTSLDTQAGHKWDEMEGAAPLVAPVLVLLAAAVSHQAFPFPTIFMSAVLHIRMESGLLQR